MRFLLASSITPVVMLLLPTCACAGRLNVDVKLASESGKGDTLHLGPSQSKMQGVPFSTPV
jgi:hypothetical protein